MKPRRKSVVQNVPLLPSSNEIKLLGSPFSSQNCSPRRPRPTATPQPGDDVALGCMPDARVVANAGVRVVRDAHLENAGGF